ncbi:hypothetical protein GCM10020331_073070 [Ectobacillus funiculus]
MDKANPTIGVTFSTKKMDSSVCWPIIYRIPIVAATLSPPLRIGKIDAIRFPNDISNTRNAIGSPIISAFFRSL